MILIIIIILSIVILFIKFKEGFLPDYSDYTFIDRAKIDSTNYAYCIGGNITSPNMNKLIDDYNGKTYNWDPSMVCNNFINLANLDISENKYLWKTPKGISFPFSTLYKGFTVPTPYIPIKLNGNYFTIYDSSNNKLDTMNKCVIVNDTYRCEMATHSLDNSYGDASFVTATDISDNINNYKDIKYNPDTDYDYKMPDKSKHENACLADYGSQIGDNLCDGTMGLLKDKNTICPYYKPICNYKCGSLLGTCNYKDKI